MNSQTLSRREGGGSSGGGDPLAPEFVRIGRFFLVKQAEAPVPGLSVDLSEIEAKLNEIEASLEGLNPLLTFPAGTTVNCFGAPKLGCVKEGHIEIARDGYLASWPAARIEVAVMELLLASGGEGRYQLAPGFVSHLNVYAVINEHGFLEIADVNSPTALRARGVVGLCEVKDLRGQVLVRHEVRGPLTCTQLPVDKAPASERMMRANLQRLLDERTICQSRRLRPAGMNKRACDAAAHDRFRGEADHLERFGSDGVQIGFCSQGRDGNVMAWAQEKYNSVHFQYTTILQRFSGPWGAVEEFREVGISLSGRADRGYVDGPEAPQAPTADAPTDLTVQCQKL